MTDKTWNKTRIATAVLSIFISFIFIQSLFFKFTGAPETVHIFGTLDIWAEERFGLKGLFGPGGVFSAHVIGTAELVASGILLAGLFLKRVKMSAIGGLMATGIMTGAIFFHLFTPLGVVVENAELGVESDGGSLFIMACIIWLSGLVLGFLHRKSLPIVGARL